MPRENASRADFSCVVNARERYTLGERKRDASAGGARLPKKSVKRFNAPAA